MVDHNPAKAPELIAYQAIITSASKQYPLHAWLNYETQFRIKVASDCTLRWEMRHSDLCGSNALPYLQLTASQPGRFPCVRCGQTSHYPENCVFRPSPAQSSNQQPGSRGAATDTDARTPVCKDFNNSRCTRTPCQYLHKCDLCRGNNTRSTCPNKGAHIRPLPWTPLQPFMLEWELSNQLDKAFVRQLIDDLQHGCNIGYLGPQFAHSANNLASRSQQLEVIDSALQKECEAGRILAVTSSAKLSFNRLRSCPKIRRRL